MTNSDTIVSQLCGAIDTIVQQRIQQLNYDKTIICTIVNDSKSANGEYQVTDGSSTFWAKCENTTYVKDEQVRVTIPNGDATQDKFIIGKYISNDSNIPITYMNPLSEVMIMTDNLFTNGSNSGLYGLTANKATEDNEGNINYSTSMRLSTINLEETYKSMVNTKIFDTVFVQADFKTLLSGYNMTSGKYGLILLLGHTTYDQNNQPVFNSVVDCVFDSSQMLGNPYNFGIYTQQAATFDVATVGTIDTIQVFCYQDGTFRHNTHGYEEIVPEAIASNILIKNITIGFGSNLATVADETVKLFTLDSLQYNNESAEADRTKKLTFAWYNKDDSGRSIGFTDGEYNTEPKGDDPWTLVDINGKKIKFIDEDKYAEAAASNMRLSQQADYNIPMDEAGLDAAARNKEIYANLNTVSLLLSKDLYQLMQNFKEYCNLDTFNDWYSQIEPIIAQQIVDKDNNKNLKTIAQDMYNEYLDGLNRAAKIHNNNKKILPETLGDEWKFIASTTDEPNLIDYMSLIQEYSQLVQNELYGEGKFFEKLLSDIIINYAGYKGIYDDYKNRIDRLFEKINKQWDVIFSTYSFNNTNLKNVIIDYFTINYKFNPWVEKDLKPYENAYCIYWYKVKSGASGDSFMPSGWERIDNNYTIYENRQVTLSSEVRKEEYKVILFFNHKKHESNNLVFENTTDFDKQLADASDYITISHGENSQESYQSYGVSNMLLNGADKYIKRNLKLSFTKFVKDSEIIDENSLLVGAQIYWYIPNNATMLDYNTNDLINLNSHNSFIKAESTGNKLSTRQKVGYTSFYKTISETKNEKNEYIDLNFCYRIKDYYLPSASQNTIICEVVKDGHVYSTEIIMNFSSYGTSGTDYTLVITPHDNQAAITQSNVDKAPWRLDISLYNNKNEKIEIPSSCRISITLLNSNISGFAVSGPQLENGQCYCNVTCGTGVKCEILKVTLTEIEHSDNKNHRLINITTYFPIPFTADPSYYIEGASTVVYDSAGHSPVYYKDPYNIFRQDNTTIPNGKWGIFYTTTDDNIKAYLPQLLDNCLKPCVTWIEDGDALYQGEKDNKTKTRYFAYVQYYEYDENKNPTNIIWSQPILIMQNRYPSPMLNAWDGSFKIDEENGTIMSTMVGAGRKNSDNQFEGVLMGDIATGSKMKVGNKTGLGIYGFNKGAQSFGLNIDGTAFFGKAGRGRLEFDGTSGQIKSSSYINLQDSGMLIDFDDGYIDMRGKTIEDSNNFSQIRIDTKSPYFKIISNTNKPLIYIANNDYYLQTNDFNNDNKTGVQLHLKDGKFTGYNFSLKALNNTGNGVELNSEGTSTNPYLSITNIDNIKLFYVDQDKFYLQSKDENLKLNLNDGSLTAQNFILQAKNGNHGIYLSSDGSTQKTPYLSITTDYQTNLVELLHFSQSAQFLQSIDYNENTKLGVKFNLKEGELKGYNFSLDAINSDNNGLILSSGKGEPYLKIVHADKTLLFVDDNEFYFNSQDGNLNFNIAEGSLSATNFILSAGNITLRSDGEPYFEIKASNGKSIAYISESDYYLQSSDFINTETEKQGIQLNLKDGQFIGYNFILKALNDKNAGVIISSDGSDNGDAYFQILTEKDGIVDTTLFSSQTQFYLKSYGFSDENKKGIKFDLTNGSLTGYKFNLKASNEQGQVLSINSGDLATPFNINDKFKIGWDGSFAVGTNAFCVDSEGNLTIGENVFNIDNTGNFWISAASLEKAPFYVDKKGAFKATKGTIGGWNIEVDKLTSNITNEIQTLDDGTVVPTQTMTLGCNGTINIGTISQTPEEIFASGGQSFGFEVDNTGRMRSQCAYLNACTITGAMLIPGKVLIRDVSIANDVNLQYVFNQKFYFDVREDAFFKEDVILASTSQLTAWYEPQSNEKPDQYHRSWIAMGDYDVDNGAQGTRGATIKIGSKNLDLYSEKIIIGHNRVSAVQEDAFTQNSNAKASTIEFRGKKTTFNHGGAEDEGVFFQGPASFEDGIILKGALTTSVAQQMQYWKIAKNAYSTLKTTDPNITDPIEIEAKETSLKTYIIMVIMKVLDNYGILEYLSPKIGKKDGQAICPPSLPYFAYYISNQELTHQFSIIAPKS